MYRIFQIFIYIYNKKQPHYEVTAFLLCTIIIKIGSNYDLFFLSSHFPTTEVANAFPKTFVALLNISQK